MNNIHTLRNILSTISHDSCPGELNFHSHTTFSDGSMDPEQLIQQAAKLKLSHIAVTDHHSIQAYPIMQQWLNNNKQFYRTLPILWSGIEITCILKKCLVHVLGFGFKIDHPCMKIYSQCQSVIGDDLQASSVISSIHKAGGLAFLAHPARYRIDYRLLIEEAFKNKFDGVEIWYDYEHNELWRPTPFICNSINELVKLHGKLGCCGTDTHGYSLKGR